MTEQLVAPRPAWTHAFEYWALQYRRNWRSTFVSGVLTPLFFLVAIGNGVGDLVGNRMHGLGGHGYLAFLAPGLLTWTAMRTAVGEATGPVTSAANWRGTYEAMLSAPLRTRDVLIGHLSWIALKVTLVCAAFLAAAACFGAAVSWLVILAVPASTLVGIACAAPAMAFAVRQTSYVRFDIVFRLIVTPLFLFSGTFFPIQQMPTAVRLIAYATPLWHGVALNRMLAFGQGAPGEALIHAGYLAAFALAGIVAAAFHYKKRLED